MLTVGDVLNSKNEQAKLQSAKEALLTKLVDFMPSAERVSLAWALRGEERFAMADVVLNAVKQIDGCPVTYQQSEVADPIVHLHYFRGGVDAWITEKDIEWPGEGDYDQSFGFVCLTGDPTDAELGYTSIKEMIESGVELDLYWTPKPLSEVKAKMRR
jgi:hypothetical protein